MCVLWRSITEPGALVCLSVNLVSPLLLELGPLGELGLPAPAQQDELLRRDLLRAAAIESSRALDQKTSK